jgi:Fur family transcriptional regulator, ferric uptake regulator
VNGKATVEDDRELHDRLEAYIKRKGLRSTAQRRLVTDVFFKTPGHFSIDELVAKVKKKDPRVGYATVYRTLKMLAESGLANERHFGDGKARFEVAHLHTHHDHLICTECGRIVEFEEDRIEELQDQVARRHGFQLRSHKHELYGVCPDCQRG